MLVDIVSKNGNLLLSVPLRGSGAIDEKEVAILKDIKAWMDVNGEVFMVLARGRRSARDLWLRLQPDESAGVQ